MENKISMQVQVLKPKSRFKSFIRMTNFKRQNNEPRSQSGKHLLCVIAIFLVYVILKKKDIKTIYDCDLTDTDKQQHKWRKGLYL